MSLPASWLGVHLGVLLGHFYDRDSHDNKHPPDKERWGTEVCSELIPGSVGRILTLPH